MADEAELLKILQTQGEQFMASFSGYIPNPPTKNQCQDATYDEDSGAESEWGGIGSDSGQSDASSEAGSGEFDDEFIQGSSTSPNVVVYSERKPDMSIDRASSKAFMSPKISKVNMENGQSQSKADAGSSAVDDLDERDNLQNDKLLHHLIHTKLLSGSLNSELNLTHAQRQKALSGRIMEVSGSAKLGRGEKHVRREEHNKASRHVRQGILNKEKKRQQAQLEESKNLGNYHPKLKRLFEDPLHEDKPKKRSRGLGMGVGRFSNGTLKLSREEISKAQGETRGGHSSRRGRGRARK